MAEISQAQGATVISKQLLGKISTVQAGDFTQETIKPANEATPADRKSAAIEHDHSDADSQGQRFAVYWLNIISKRISSEVPA
ncbi:dihydrolipoamide succinyltransferase [Actinobacillus equuli]|nr:dihydrolipoamide succinyltransferase [Actinobacillus equuli]